MRHYAPTEGAIVGETPGIWAFLGSDRLAAPIAQHEPDLVVHGHAHTAPSRGRFPGVPSSRPEVQSEGAAELI